MDYPNPIDVQTWQQVVVTVVLIVTIGVVPGLFAYLGNRNTKRLEDTLTKNNGGSTVKDQLDRIEDRQIEHGNRLDALEQQSRPRRRLF